MGKILDLRVFAVVLLHQLDETPEHMAVADSGEGAALRASLPPDQGTGSARRIEMSYIGG